MSGKWWKDNEPRTRSQPTLFVSPGDFTNRRRRGSLVEKSPVDSTRPLRRSSPRSRLFRAHSNSPLLPVPKRKTAKMPVKRSTIKPRTPQGQLIDVEGGETEAEMETITSVNADILQRELQTVPQLTFRGEFQSPPPHKLLAPPPVTVTVTAPLPVTVTELLVVTVTVTVRYLMPVTVTVNKPVRYKKPLCQGERQKL
jgi:hypothetical protein